MTASRFVYCQSISHEWNAAVARAQELLESSERGELTDEELRRRFEEF